jgi:hypothetical protein
MIELQIWVYRDRNDEPVFKIPIKSVDDAKELIGILMHMMDKFKAEEADCELKISRYGEWLDWEDEQSRDIMERMEHDKYFANPRWDALCDLNALEEAKKDNHDYEH